MRKKLPMPLFVLPCPESSGSPPTAAQFLFFYLPFAWFAVSIPVFFNFLLSKFLLLPHSRPVRFQRLSVSVFQLFSVCVNKT
jgi:hypothetical protein